jgi:hypothetical protein
MAIHLPKVKFVNTNIKMPKLSNQALKGVTAPKIGYPKPVLGNAIKTKINLK